MATIVRGEAGKGESAQIVETELTGADDFTGTNGALFVRNASGGGVTISIHGDGSTGTKLCDGGGVVDLSVPFDVTVADGEIEAIALGSIRDFLRGNITATGGAASVFAYIV